jgi:predicted PurR-regulated permease PerM
LAAAGWAAFSEDSVDSPNGKIGRRQVLTVTDPQPVAAVSTLWRTATQAATIGIFVVLFIAALDLARPILLPAASAFVVTMMLGPLSARADRLGVPPMLTAIALWLLVTVVFYGLIVLLSAPVMVAFFHKREARLRMLRIMNDVEHNLTGYLSVVAMINIVVGLGAGIVAWAVGLPDPLAWGVLGFVLNFIPYIGALIMELGMFMVGLVSFPSLTYALVAPLAFLALAVLEGHFITPSILGRHFTLNPLTVFLSLIFWTWLWGPVGAFLAAPLLIVGMVAVLHLFPKQTPELPE